ncbi:FitA-like ribbon-helix-helix domain-containing protein [Thiothrix subterranea]|uniref:Arc family DNA-binding protein n=1 Tax=Thiothrix subterranea TaxID=2735563 RepID=A0AA51MPU5_9GAMM|nr:Arc family DNA-binding protein [Thiothrix subterranea]MDQ5769934.1 Arc family DNA-binding protein [Thiothrix subterranea]WML86041.1 Arc family DNA-binding protein [Thiothrix subterranea]
MTEADKRTQARIPADVHQWLTDRAKTNDRSMNAELVRILKEVKDGTIEKTAYERGKRDGFELASNP